MSPHNTTGTAATLGSVRKQPWKLFCDPNSEEFRTAIDNAPDQKIFEVDQRPTGLATANGSSCEDEEEEHPALKLYTLENK